MRSLTYVCFLGFVAAACGGKDEESLPEIDCDKVTVPAFAEVRAFSQNCVACHATAKTGAARSDAPAEWNFDDYASAASNPEEVVSEVYGGAMPPAGAAQLSEADKQQVYAWGLCGPKM